MIKLRTKFLRGEFREFIIRPSYKEQPSSWPQGYKTFSYSAQLSMEFILLINVKMPTIVGILTFISMMNTTSEIIKASNFFICRYFFVYEQLEFRAHLI